MAVLLLLAAAPLLGHAVSPIQSSDALEKSRIAKPKVIMRKQSLGERAGEFPELTELVAGKADSRSATVNYCMLDFPFGEENTSNCVDGPDGVTDNRIGEGTLCGVAAFRHRASAHNIDVAFKEIFPRGCFKASCNLIESKTCSNPPCANQGLIQAAPFELEDWVTDKTSVDSTGQIAAKHSDGQITIVWNDTSRTDVNKTSNDLLHYPDGDKCFFFNAYQTDPNGYFTPPDGSGTRVYMGINGKPVCTRTKYAYGTSDTKGGSKTEAGDTGGGCQEGMDVIVDYDDCATAAGCMGQCVVQHFNVNHANSDDYNKYPKGCFKHTSDTGNGLCVAFNPTPNIFQNPPALPSDPKGTPICSGPY